MEIQNEFYKLYNMIVEASQAAIAIYEAADHEVQIKDDKSPVTAADLAVNTIILSKLREITPNIPIISEETKTSYEFRKDFEEYWLLDPIDGTKEFIKKTGEFTINLGLIQKGKPTFGFVYVPAKNKMYFGGSMIGNSYKETFCIQIPPQSLDKFIANISLTSKQPLKVDTVDVNTEKLIIACSKDHSTPPDDAFVLNLSKSFFVKRVAHGSTIKQLLLCEGKVHFCPRAYAPYDWDLAAPHAIVLGAGGDVSTFEGNPITYNTETQRLPSFMTTCKVDFDWREFLSTQNDGHEARRFAI